MPFMPIVLAGAMIILMIRRGGILLMTGVLPWFAFLLWVTLAAVNVPSSGSWLAYGYRAGSLAAIGVLLLYVSNARENITAAKVVWSSLIILTTMVVLGFLAMSFPEYRLTTIVGRVMPGALSANDFIREMVFPALAEVQSPHGAPTPFNRPSAPFLYANSWGVMFVVLVPVAFAAVSLARNRFLQVGVATVVAAASVPALATSNRGMFVGLLASLGYVLVRLLLRGHAGRALAGFAAAGLVGAALVWSGALQAVLDRQLYSDSTGGRLRLYQETWRAALDRPLLGYGTPRLEESIGVAMGTQGYFWMLMFCYGFVGLVLFLVFMAGAVARTWKVESTALLWLHSVPIGTLAIMPFYGFDTMQLTVLVLILALLLRESAGAIGGRR
ncbi:hypothetical protein BN1051_00827 [Arthrobacter saudimassiliensis]|uniref:O-antigen ligase-related domain-containing protein n=1 Tax=Arthrobacter saudimassiliensis TaxID=1461584 RepID=A0A078MQ43_9MICC|nr:hypothetical protein BN1051_00827 [Arthrobacter saudimassiliensis]